MRFANRARSSDSHVMRRPSPALAVGMVALFVALGGAGVAASLAVSQVFSAKPLMLLPGSVSAAGKVTGARMSGGRVSQGVYTLTILGNSFASSKTSVHATISPLVTGTADGTGTSAQFPGPPSCETASETIAQNGSATVQVDCFAYGSSGWKPTDAAFDVQIVGPKR